MAAQVQLQKQQVVSGWLSLFQEVKTYNQSKLFIKQLTAVAISCITYMRGIFPEDAYTSRSFDEKLVKLLCGSYACKDAYLLTRFIKSAFEALDLEYMHQLIFEIIDEESRSVIEYYTCEYTYMNNDTSCSLIAGQNKENPVFFDDTKMKITTAKLIQSLLEITEDVAPLPRKYFLQLRVTYYEEKTPETYKPKYFLNQDEVQNEVKRFDEYKIKDWGSTTTPFHSIVLRGASALLEQRKRTGNFFDDLTGVENDQDEKAIKRRLFESPTVNLKYRFEDGAATSKDDASRSNKCEETKANKQKYECFHTSIGVSAPFSLSEKVKRKFDLEGNSGLIDESSKQGKDTDMRGNDQSSSRTEEGAEKGRCPCCLISTKHSFGESFECQQCGKWQHFICYKLKPNANGPTNPNCYWCAKVNPNLICADPSLVKYTPKVVEKLTLHRHVLYSCASFKTLTTKDVETYFNVSSDKAEYVICKMASEGFISLRKKSTTQYKINSKKVLDVLETYFQIEG